MILLWLYWVRCVVCWWHRRRRRSWRCARGRSGRSRPWNSPPLALLICLLHVAVVPWQMALAKVPGLDALIFSIPYTAIFLLGLRLVPKPGVATLLMFGQGIFGQMLGRGINPAWWPYYLMCRGGR